MARARNLEWGGHLTAGCRVVVVACTSLMAPSVLSCFGSWKWARTWHLDCVNVCSNVGKASAMIPYRCEMGADEIKPDDERKVLLHFFQILDHQHSIF
jgi:hypothetical protein